MSRSFFFMPLTFTLNRWFRSKKRNDGNRADEYSKIHKGEIYIQDDFLTPLEISSLREDIAQLRHKGCFKPSGLSNRVEGDQNTFGSSDRLTCTITPDLFPGDKQLSNTRFKVEEKMEHLKQRLQSIRNPRSDLGSDLGVQHESESKMRLAEMYYSISPEGSHLPRHQDERHEDTKGIKGYINETRRSISWLIYLNCDNWGSENNICTNANQKEETTTTTSAPSTTNESCNGEDSTTGVGGELRAYCRTCCGDEHVLCGSHEGDLQVGWLRSNRKSCSSSPTTGDIEFEPVFLDSWVKTKTLTPDSDLDSNQRTAETEYDNEIISFSIDWQPMSALYRLRRNKNFAPPSKDESRTRRTTSLSQEYFAYNYTSNSVREYLSIPFGPNSPSWPSNHDLEPTEFAEALALQLERKDHQSRFVGTEDIRGGVDSGGSSEIKVVDVVPKGGRLVLFDSVTVPHEVLEVIKGTRLAIAGWFHEPQQEFPDWYGS
eukprot:jgi/Psemu1/291180/fgenesh1_pg.639_\